jgi:hypothetical protein
VLYFCMQTTADPRQLGSAVFNCVDGLFRLTLSLIEFREPSLLNELRLRQKQMESSVRVLRYNA